MSASSLVGLGLGDLAHGGQEVKRASSHHFFLIYVTTLPSCPLEIILWPTHGTQVLGQSPIKLINTGQYFVRFVRSTALCLATSYHILMIQTFFLYTAYMIFRISGCQEDSLLSCRLQPSFPFPFKMNHIVWSYRKTPSLLRQERKYARSAIPKNANEGGSKYAAIKFPKNNAQQDANSRGYFRYSNTPPWLSSFDRLNISTSTTISRWVKAPQKGPCPAIRKKRLPQHSFCSQYQEVATSTVTF